jgi:hypothetical protein
VIIYAYAWSRSQHHIIPACETEYVEVRFCTWCRDIALVSTTAAEKRWGFICGNPVAGQKIGREECECLLARWPCVEQEATMLSAFCLGGWGAIRTLGWPYSVVDGLYLKRPYPSIFGPPRTKYD